MLGRIWFDISDLYAIKRYMRLSGMQLTDFLRIIIITFKKQKWPVFKKLFSHNVSGHNHLRNTSNDFVGLHISSMRHS